MKIFVGCSSSDNIPEKYLKDAEIFLNQLFEAGHDLVFGASNTGIMGIAHNCALKYHREIVGVCPEIYKHDFNKLNCSKELIAKSVSDRTEKVINEADVLIFMPGGIGTLYELLTSIESKRSHEFDKPIIIYDSQNYFKEFFVFLDKVYDEYFTAIKVKDSYHVCTSAKEVMEYLEKNNKVVNEVE